ncbi:MAG: DUF4271 domain-containing protein [Bacteroidales bacterium]|jgi:hypothetical protein|nr:DUF4271 domain-containing protein [Bacteroidales bacterium]MDD2617380.1 DUF4271 domain-containing protein [Bacteroidales bacterium]MDD4640239.1 DUF4271 domain-containing protein [Bacteroidales bacterium]
MAVQDYVRSELFDYREAPDSLKADISENSLTTISKPLHEGLPRQEGPMSGLKPFIVLILGLFVFSYVFGSRSSLFLHSLKDIFVYRERSSIFVDSDVRLVRYQRLLAVFGFIICLLLLSLIFQSGQQASLNKLDTIRLGYALLFLGVFILVKSLLYWFFTLFQFDATTARQWQNDNLLLFIVLSLLYAILVFINEIVFISLENLLSIALILWISNKLILSAKTMHYFSQQRLSWFHFIIYLCTLEILPLCIFYKGIIWIRDIV